MSGSEKSTGRTLDERARRLMRGLEELSERVTGPWRQGSSLLEIQRSIVDDVAEKVAEIGSGKRVFPYHRVEVDLRFVTDEERAVAAAALEAGWAGELKERIATRLEEMRCLPVELAVAVAVREEPSPADGPFHELHVERVEEREEPVAAAAASRPVLALEVIRGAAEETVYRFDQERVLIGRLVDVLDQHGRIKRRNHLAFLDEGDENETVSREHARIVWRDEPSGWWLADERSAYGTRIFRDGKPIDVSSRDRRGVRLKDGDEIYLGRAVLRCGIAERG
ncbi:MAG TPA: FHA domain-containing protein [Thermoanaerobaculia bacterium]|nr:FHA domain-containing protein [Thermoanaerobaculia bacterium]